MKGNLTGLTIGGLILIFCIFLTSLMPSTIALRFGQNASDMATILVVAIGIISLFFGAMEK